MFLPVPDKPVDGRKIGKSWSCWYESDLFGNVLILTICRGEARSDQLSKHAIGLILVYMPVRGSISKLYFHTLIDVYSEEDPPSH